MEGRRGRLEREKSALRKLTPVNEGDKTAIYRVPVFVGLRMLLDKHENEVMEVR